MKALQKLSAGKAGGKVAENWPRKMCSRNEDRMESEHRNIQREIVEISKWFNLYKSYRIKKNNEKNVFLNSYKVTVFRYAGNNYVHSNGCTFAVDSETPQRNDEPRLLIADLIVY